PSIAETLLITGELSNELTMTKRMTEATILISSFIACPLVDPKDDSKPIPKDPRSSLSIARMNWIHSPYKISNDDLLYSLCSFSGQKQLMERCEWRPISPEELECLFILWKEIGRRMGIQNISATVDDLREWSDKYELRHMVPSETSRELAQIAVNNISRRVPDLPGLCRLVSGLFIRLLDDRFRIAMMLPAQPACAHWTVKTFCSIRVMFIRHCCLPHLKPVAYIALENPPSGIGPDRRMRLYTLL
ncbi:hypothetical protein FB451DRAFT_1045233, partial [Mycena latifolia]